MNLKQIIKMRKMTKLASLLAIAGMALLSSCGGGEDTPPAITLDVAETTAELGGTVTFTASISTDGKLETLDVTESSDLGGAAAGVDLGKESSASYTYTGTIPDDAALIGNTVTVTVSATDKKGNTGTADFKVMVQATPTSAKLLGAQLASAGSFYNSTTEEVMGTAATKDAPANVDISFAELDAAGKPNLVSPDHRDELGMSEIVGGEVTYFAESSLDILNATEEALGAISASSDKNIEVEAGKTYQFVNQRDEKGLIMIDGYSAGDNFNGELTIKVRMLK